MRHIANMTQKTLQKKLKALKKESSNDLEKYVIDDLLEEDDIQGYIKDLTQYGCVSGMVSALIYYHDTKAFFAQYMDEIEELKEEDEEAMGEPLKIGTPMYNWLAWYGYERTAQKIADTINLEY